MPFLTLMKPNAKMAVSSIKAGNKQLLPFGQKKNEPSSPSPKILQTHQLNMPFGTLAAEVLYQVQQTWGVNFSADDIKLTIPDRTQYRPLPLPADMNVREALDRYRPRWHQEQNISLNLSRPFEDRSAPYTLRIECECTSDAVRMWDHRNDTPLDSRKCCSMCSAAARNICCQVLFFY